MASGTVVKHWRDSGTVYLAVAVNEGVGGNVEYIGSTPAKDDQGVAKTAPQIRTELLAAISAQRPGNAPTVLNTISGTVAV